MASTSIVENYPDPIRSEFADDLELVKLAETVSNEENMSGKIKYDLREKINALTAVDHINLFKIVYNHNYKKVHTTTNRGTFFDLNDLDNKTLWKVEKFISLILNKMEQDKVAEKIEHEKKITELANKNRLKENLKNERKIDDSLIPRGNHSKHQQKSGNNFYDEILASSTTASTNSTAVSTAATSNQSSTPKVTTTNTPSVTADNKAKEAKEAKVAFPMSNALSMFMNRTSDSTTSSVPANTTAKTLGKVVTLGKVSNNPNVSTLGKFQKVDTRNDFVGGSVCITDEDLDGPNGLTNGEEGDEDDENDEDGLEDDDEDYDGEEEEGEYDLDPNQMIKNGGRSYVDDE